LSLVPRFFGDLKKKINEVGLSRKHIIEGMNASLKRLQLEYVDLVFCHRPDPKTPIEETVRAMNYLISHGKAFYWGTSEWSAREYTEATEIAKRLGLIPPLMEQPQYNMLHRTRFEVEYEPLYKQYGMGTTIWSPLASGVLTGKYNNGIPEGSRLSFENNSWLKKGLLSGQGINGLEEKSFDAIIDKSKKLTEFSSTLDCSVAQLAIAWCCKNPNVSSVITGASSVQQVHDNMKSLQIVPKLTQDVMSKIDDILQNNPKKQK